MTETKRKHRPMQHRFKKTIRKITRWRQRGYGISGKWVREYLILVLAGVLGGCMLGYAGSWMPLSRRDYNAPPRQLIIPFPTMQPENFMALVVALGAGYVLGAPLGIILAGRLMGRITSEGAAFIAFYLIGLIVTIALGWLLLNILPAGLLVMLMLLLPSAFAAAGYQIDVSQHKDDEDED